MAERKMGKARVEKAGMGQVKRRGESQEGKPLDYLEGGGVARVVGVCVDIPVTARAVERLFVRFRWMAEAEGDTSFVQNRIKKGKM